MMTSIMGMIEVDAYKVYCLYKETDEDIDHSSFISDLSVQMMTNSFEGGRPSRRRKRHADTDEDDHEQREEVQQQERGGACPSHFLVSVNKFFG